MTPTVKPANIGEAIGKRRWTICLLLFAATTIELG